MKKGIFSSQEAHLVAFPENPALINLQLHQWKKNGDILSLKRGLFLFADAAPEKAEIAKNLYSPCYFGLEYVLGSAGILPEAVFTYTLVTPKLPRHFETSLGTFSYQKIKKEAFVGFDSVSLMAEKEKALVDYFYLHSAELHSNKEFWESSRLEAVVTEINFKKVFQYAKLFRSKKLLFLLHNFHSYATSYTSYR
ncbi:hypothetical protein HZA38_00565 [Candidatus Peregrinibacteria bacterium]|nr:hypothetical protein [Candidatus Peregrinibacteria bacterium]